MTLPRFQLEPELLDDGKHGRRRITDGFLHRIFEREVIGPWKIGPIEELRPQYFTLNCARLAILRCFASLRPFFSSSEIFSVLESLALQIESLDQKVCIMRGICSFGVPSGAFASMSHRSEAIPPLSRLMTLTYIFTV
jgi:hypothetical protein